MGESNIAPKLSICMIVKNEESLIESCINNLKDVADELIVVDTGSTDNTPNILSSIIRNNPALNSKLKVHSFAWVDDFSAARNFSLTKATGDWILIIDADEYITKDDFKKIRSTIKNTLFAGFQLLQRTYTNKSDQASWHPVAPEYPYSRGFFGYFDTPITRLFRNNSSFKFMGRVHEDITMSIKEQKLPLTVSDVIIHHYEYSRGKSFVKDKQLYYLELTLKKIKDQPTNPKSYYDAGIIYYNYKHDSDKALYYFRKALEVDTKYDVASNYVAKILAEKGNHEESIHVLKSAIELGSKNETTYINLGVIYMNLGRLDDALEIFKKASLINPQKITPYYNIGLVLVKQKQFGKAIDMFKKCLALNPTDGRVYLHLALLYQKINQPERAIKYYKALASSNHPHKEQFLKKIEELEHNTSANSSTK